MRADGNATASFPVTQLRRPAASGPDRARPAAGGLAWGALGVLAFSATLPATRLAELGGLDALFVGLGRAVVAGLLAAGLLAWTRQPWPQRRDRPRLLLVALGVVVGFPLFSALALTELPASHGAIITGLLPSATAAAAVLRAGERPSRAFWAAAGAGLACVLAFAAVAGAGRPEPADGLALLAVALGALGYAEGGVLARRLGAWQAICWALVACLPALLPLAALWLAWAGPPQAGAAAWAGFAYVSLVSMFLAFFAWYRGLARGGVARVGQVQLAQPVLTLAWSALLLGEEIGPATAGAALAVLGCVAMTQLARGGGGPETADRGARSPPTTHGWRAAEVWRAFGRMAEAARTRRHLAEMDARMLADIGLSRAEARAEASRRFWDTAPPHWDWTARRRGP